YTLDNLIQCVVKTPQSLLSVYRWSEGKWSGSGVLPSVYEGKTIRNRTEQVCVCVCVCVCGSVKGLAGMSCCTDSPGIHHQQITFVPLLSDAHFISSSVTHTHTPTTTHTPTDTHTNKHSNAHAERHAHTHTHSHTDTHTYTYAHTHTPTHT